MILPLTDFLENETNDIQFVCQAIGVPIPNIRWYFNGIMVNLSDSSKFTSSSLHLNESITESTFGVRNTKSSDVGTYTCVVSNIIGTDRSSGVLTVNGKYVYCYVCIISISLDKAILFMFMYIYYRCC